MKRALLKSCSSIVPWKMCNAMKENIPRHKYHETAASYYPDGQITTSTATTVCVLSMGGDDGLAQPAQKTQLG